jgi:hypothetical protein
MIAKFSFWFWIVSTLIFIFFILVVLPQQSNLALAFGLKESVDTSWFYNARDLYRIAESYGPLGREFYIYQRWTFDLIWPFVYFSFIFSVSALLYQSIGLSKINRWILSFIWIGTVFDFIENTMVSLVMYRYPLPTWIIADFAGTATSLKWIFIGLSFLVMLLLIGVKAIQVGLQIARKYS